MPGIQGMASPKQGAQDFAPPVPTPQAIQLPPVAAPAPAPDSSQATPAAPQADNIDYAAIAQSIAANPPAPVDNINYAEVASQIANQDDGSFTMNPSKLADRFVNDVSNIGKAASKVGQFVDQITLAPIRGGINAAMDNKSVLGGAVGGLMGKPTPSSAQLLEKGFPSLKNADGGDFQDFLETAGPLGGPLAFANKMLAKDGEKAAINFKVSPAESLGMAADLLAGVGEAKAISGLGTITKLGVAALGDAWDAQKAAAIVKANASALSPLRQAELASNSLQTTSQELNKINDTLKFTPNVVDLTNAHEVKVAQSLANNAQFQAIQVKQGEDIADAILKHSEAFANLEPKTGGAKSIFDTISDAAGAEGRILGKYKGLARDAAGDQTFQVSDNLSSKLQDIMDAAGYGKAGSRPTAESASVALNISQDEAKDLLPKIESLFNKTQRPMTYGEAEQLNNNLSVMTQSLKKDSFSVQKIANGLRQGASDNLADLTGQLLQDSHPNAFKDYTDARGNYSSILKSYEKIPGIVNKDDMSADNLVKYIMSGNANVDKFEAVQNILQKQNPEMVKDLNGAFINRLFFDNLQTPSVNSPLKYDFSGIKTDLKKFAGSDGKMLDIMTGDPVSSKQLMQFVDMADGLTKSIVANKPVINETALARTLYLASKIGAPKEMISEGILMASRDKNLLRYIDAAGVQDMSKMVPSSDRPGFINYMRALNNEIQDKAEINLKKKLGQ